MRVRVLMETEVEPGARRRRLSFGEKDRDRAEAAKGRKDTPAGPRDLVREWSPSGPRDTKPPGAFSSLAAKCLV